MQVTRSIVRSVSKAGTLIRAGVGGSGLLKPSKGIIRDTASAPGRGRQWLTYRPRRPACTYALIGTR